MMLRPVVKEIRPGSYRQPLDHDPFIDDLTPSQAHAFRRCESVRPPVVVAVDVWALEDGNLL